MTKKIENNNFINDKEKMRDFKEMTKEEFLLSYSYLAEEEYNNTEKELTKIKDRLEYLRGEIEKDYISYGEIVELVALKEYIEPGDTVLLEWAGVPEFEEEKKEVNQLNIVTCGSCGRVFAHELGVEELTCPYCKTTGDISDFPDLFYPPHHNDSIINIKKHYKYN